MSPFKSGAGRNLGKLIKSYRTFNVGDSFPQAPRPFTASGGNHVLTPGNGYTYHTFTSSGAFVSSGGPKSIEFILVAGGGGGGGCNNSAAGGGGGGGVVISSGFVCSEGSHPITVGAGGAGQAGDSLGTVNPGADAIFTYVGTGAETFTAKGGGGGTGPQGVTTGGDGGSGGGTGGSETQSTQNPGILHITNYGNDSPSHGGGGAGGSGNVPSGVGGPGQPAPGYEYPLVLPSGLATPLQPYSPTNNHYAGGGSGYTGGPTGYPYGGGGPALSSDGGNGTPGISLLGGGGGHAWKPSAATGGNGGDGIIIVRYLV